MTHWAKKRMAELVAAAPVRRKKTEPFVMVSLTLAGRAAVATDSQKVMVWLWLTYRAWKTRSNKIAVPNGALAEFGVSREIKRRALLQLEAAGLIAVDRKSRKTPEVTLL